MTLPVFALLILVVCLCAAIYVLHTYVLHTYGQDQYQRAEYLRDAFNRELAKGDELRQEIERLQEIVKETVAKEYRGALSLNKANAEKADLASRLLHATAKLDAIRNALGMPEEDDGPSEDMLAAWRGLDADLRKELGISSLPPDAE